MHRLKYIIICLSVIYACNNPQPEIDVQGHRGCRGYFPENTIVGFLEAMKMGVSTLEMDVVITKDTQVLLSHEPFMNHEICELAGDSSISRETEKNYNIYKLTYEEIKKFDCGSKRVERFPDQTKLSVHKPLLSEVIDATESFIQQSNSQRINYNIEIKSWPDGDLIFHPEPKEFARLLLKMVSQKGIKARTTIQSFDIRSLQATRSLDPDIQTALLIANLKPADYWLDSLGFTPEIYSPYFKLVDSSLVRFCHDRGMQLIPWTVNDKKDIHKMLELGVDGIISDYPDRVISLIQR